MDIWEGWLDYGNCTWEGKTIEDATPLSEKVLKALASLLVSSYKLRSFALEVETPSLNDVDAVKVTAWLRHLMDLHVDEQKSFSELILLHSSAPEFLQALYHHISMLPQLQYGINQCSQSLLKKFEAGTSRLDHFQQTQIATERLQNEMDNHIIRLEHVVGEFYSSCQPADRSKCRWHLGHLWYHFIRTTESRSSGVKENTSAIGLGMTLRVLLRILQGTSAPFHPSYRHLLFYILVPLHRPSSMVLWRDQTPILDLYHEPLVKCIAVLLNGHPEWKSPTIRALLGTDIWPHAKGGSNGSNTPKIVLLLHQINTFLTIPGEVDEPTWDAFMTRLSVCIASDNSRLAEQALQMFRNDKFNELFQVHCASSLPILLRATVKTDLPWNPTVRKMTYHVLKTLREQDETAFSLASRMAFVDGGKSEAKASTGASGAGSAFKSSQAEKYKPDFSLKGTMGDWKPPTHQTQNHRPIKHSMLPPPMRPPKSRAPPLTITGVAPWSKSKGGNPPLTITGVAPWASQAPGLTQRSSTSNTPIVTASEDEPEVDNAVPQGLARVLAYMEQIKPSEEEGDGTSSWAKDQMSESPTLLPSLKFHDLVFGQDLGSGAFGTVRYARLIDKSLTRSFWPEYAVKIISTTKIVELGYEQSIKREIAVLRVLSHPGIARLVSSFRFKDGAYLVLEYASRGDLHTLLQTSGSLDVEATKFVIGEVVAALSSVHELGFVYGDLKPENILITETGHIKITDFGACRPVTDAAKDIIGDRTSKIMSELRDGGWKSSNQVRADLEQEEPLTGWSGSIVREPAETDIEDGDEDDNRIEGTTAYLPPEVVMGAIPTTAADIWALGCVLYQCLSGRPPHLENDEESTRRKIVHFDHAADDQQDRLFSDSHSTDIAPKAQALIRRVLARNSVDRPSVHQVSEDDFFEGTHVFGLYKLQAYPLDAGKVQPKADAQWARRQFSSIWAPQPKTYDISMPPERNSLSTADPVTAPIVEGPEGPSFFSFTDDDKIEEM